jgi:Pyruvate/2-oxoacid:ferredoxin oxidoreductase gamma subunit
VAVTVPESQKDVLNAFNRKSLLEAYKNGEKRVMRIVNQIDENNEIHKIAIEDYFMENERNSDVYVVSFIQNLDFEDGTYV